MAHPLNRYAHPLSRIEDKNATPGCHQLDNNMNKDNAAQYLPLVQALAEGKTIQVANRNKTTWIDLDEGIVWSENPDYYRIKPEPREWRAAVSPHTGELYSVQSVDGLGGWQIIRVREILD